MMDHIELTAYRRKHFTQAEFAKLLGVTSDHWSRVERSKFISIRRTSSLFKLAEVILTYKEYGVNEAIAVLMR